MVRPNEGSDTCGVSKDINKTHIKKIPLRYQRKSGKTVTYSSGNILHDEKFQKTNEKNDLSQSSLRNSVRARDGGKTIRERVKAVSLQVNVSGKVDSGTGDDLSKEGKHGDTSVLELDVSETLELGFISIGNKAKRIVESKRFLCTQFTLES
jgi:hypothetical protein